MTSLAQALALPRIAAAAGVSAVGHRSTLVWVAGAVELFTALVMVGAPDQFRAASYAAVRPHVPSLGAAFLVATVLVVLYGVGALRGRAGGIALAAASAPLAAFALGFAVTSAYTGLASYGSLALGLLFVAAEEGTGRTLVRYPLRLSVALGQGSIGVLMLVVPAQFPPAVYASVIPILGLIGAIYVATALALLFAARLAPGALMVITIVAAINYLPLFQLSLGIRAWTGAVVYASLVFGLLLTSWRPTLRSAVGIGSLFVAVIAVDDLIAWATLSPATGAFWSRMRPDFALAMIALAATLLTDVGPFWRGRARLRTMMLLAAAALGAHNGYGALVGLVSANARELVGQGGAIVSAPLPSGALSVGVLVTALWWAGARDSARATLWLAVTGTALAGAALVNVIAYVVNEPFLLATYGIVAMRLHGAVATLALGVAIVVFATPQVWSGKIAGRVIGSLGVMLAGIVVVGFYATAAASEIQALLLSDAAAAAALVRGAAAVAGALLIAFALGTFAFGIMLSRTVTHPLTDLATTMRRFTRGERALRMHSVGADEVSSAANAFDAMADSLAASESEIQGLNATLEQRVRERTAQLQAATQELEAFSYSVSHDLRSPLRAVDGFSAALSEDFAADLSAPARRYLDLIRAGTAEMSRLIDDLLRLSLVTRGELRRERVDLAAISRELLESHRTTSRRELGTTICDDMVVMGDPGLLRALMENLISNALKFSRIREVPVVRVGCTTVDGAPAYFVGDNGVGFDMAHAAKLFSPFQRLHSSAEFEGTGIGLATVDRIARRHGGRVWAESQPDRGATIYFTLGGRTA